MLLRESTRERRERKKGGSKGKSESNPKKKKCDLNKCFFVFSHKLL